MNDDEVLRNLALKMKPGTAFAAMAGIRPRSLETREKWPFDRASVPAPLRRKVSMGRITLHVDRFNLDELLSALLDAQGYNKLADVPDEALFRMEAWLEQHVERLETGCCDPHSLPAN